MWPNNGPWLRFCFLDKTTPLHCPHIQEHTSVFVHITVHILPFWLTREGQDACVGPSLWLAIQEHVTIINGWSGASG